jgi:murein DD-endopeptidase MepM/ murein hydrolase activator NlpD
MLSRRRSLVGVYQQGAQSLAAVLCVVALVLPSLGQARSRRSVGSGPDRLSGEESPRDPNVLPETLDGSSGSGDPSAVPAEPRVTHDDRTEAGSGAWGQVDEHVHIRRGDTLEHVLLLKGLGAADSYPWLRAAQGVYDLRLVQPKRGFSLKFDRATRQLESVRYEIDGRSLLVLERGADGYTVTGRREALPYFVEVKGAAGRIEHGLREDTMEAGVPPAIASEMVDIFGWDLEVGAHLNPGDEFRVIYENLWETGKSEPTPGKILGAEIVTRGAPLIAVLFETEDGSGGYYRPDGGALSRDFLRYPLEFREISSEFSMSRYHPILHRWRPHMGVDLAAPRGTPVRAVADGWVKETGWMGGLGRAVRLEHVGDRVTTYGHLVEVAPGIQEGVTVEQGQVIGYVGSTGLATGNHLHYEVEEGGTVLDPMEFQVEPDAPVADSQRRAFDRVRVKVTRELASLTLYERPTAVTLSAADVQGE